MRTPQFEMKDIIEFINANAFEIKLNRKKARIISRKTVIDFLDKNYKYTKFGLTKAFNSIVNSGLIIEALPDNFGKNLYKLIN